MSDEIFASAQKFAAQFGGFLKAAEQWEKVASIDRAADEAQARLDRLRAEEEEAIKAREKRRIAREGEAAGHYEKLDAMTAASKGESERIIAAARVEAARIVAAAAPEASARREKAEADAAAAQERADALARSEAECRSRQTQAQAELAAVEAQVVERQAKLAELNEHIAELKRKF